LAGRLAAHAVPLAPERFGRRLPFGSELGDRFRRSVEARWFGHSLCTTTSGPAHQVWTGRSVEACWTSSVSDRVTLGGRRFVGARHIRAGILFELGFWTPLCSVHLAAPLLASVPKHLGLRRRRSARSLGVHLFRGAETLWSGFALPSSPPTNDRFPCGPQRQRCSATSPVRLAVWGHVAVHAETQPTRYSRRAGPSGQHLPVQPSPPRRNASVRGFADQRHRRSSRPEAPRRNGQAFSAASHQATLQFGRFPPHRTHIVFDGRLVIRETPQTRPSGCFRLGCPRGAETLQVQLRLRRPSGHLPYRTACALHIGSRLADRPSALRPQPSWQSLLRRRNTSVGTVVWTKTMERRAGWRCRSPQRKDALVSDFAVCARNPDRYTTRRSAWY
jgi:hypothetical protein